MAGQHDGGDAPPHSVIRSPSVAVVGSVNSDLLITVSALPVPGETIMAESHARHPGGKGANQAVAVARLGCDVALVGRVGDDDVGHEMRRHLEAENVQVDWLLTTSASASGLAVVTVDHHGENSIVVSSGANQLLTADDIAGAGTVLCNADVTLLQLEIPLDAVMEAARRAAGNVILNPAPATDLPAELLDLVDILVPNRSELARLVGAVQPRTVEEAAVLASQIRGPKAIVVTLGQDGAVLVAPDAILHVSAMKGSAVDTTGAGDAFCGALAEATARGRPIASAVKWAVAAAGLAVLRGGAQPGMPTREETASALRARPLRTRTVTATAGNDQTLAGRTG